MLNKGLFDLSFLKSDDSVGDLKLESDEFETHCPSNDPTKHFDADNSGNRTIPVPGGDKEEPSAKPANGEFGPKPNGLSERPSAKIPGGELTVTSNSATLDSDTYNKALDQLKKSFKESYDIVDMLSRTTIMAESAEARADDYALQMMAEAYMDGPLFEAVDRSDKEAVKGIVKKIKPKMEAAVKAVGGCKYRDSRLLLELGANTALAMTGVGTAIGTGGLVRTFGVMIKNRLWQILGTVYIEEGSVDTLTKALNEKFSEKLGKYKILATKLPAVGTDLYDTICQKFGWKNNKDGYLLIVDKKIPAEVKKACSGSGRSVKKDEDIEESACNGGKCDEKGSKARKDDDDDDNGEDYED